MRVAGVNSNHLEQALTLAGLIKKDRKLATRLANRYWQFAFRATRLYERYIPQKPADLDNDILNFGCGYQLYENAVNSDLLTPHRFLKGKKRPDLYWSGTTELKTLSNRFNGIVCEHVIEHILPDDVMGLFGNFLSALKSGGTIVVTFPDIRKVLECDSCQGFSSSTVATNSVIYRFEHVFMYDTEIICEMLKSVGFKNALATSYDESALNQFLDPVREVETAYVTATKP